MVSMSRAGSILGIAAALALGSGALRLMLEVRIPLTLFGSYRAADVTESAIESAAVLVGVGLLALSVGFVAASARAAYSAVRELVAWRREREPRPTPPS